MGLSRLEKYIQDILTLCCVKTISCRIKVYCDSPMIFCSYYASLVGIAEPRVRIKSDKVRKCLPERRLILENQDILPNIVADQIKVKKTISPQLRRRQSQLLMRCNLGIITQIISSFVPSMVYFTRIYTKKVS